ncbi:MAG: hypothetical protein LBQ73_11790 [Tannerellaceae bacterium]|jgi:hypothetical protein|nr:hypothetical protein [Tannerellaceae bacterium]
MKKIFNLLVLPFLLFSCFEEEAVPGFFSETTWVSNNSGSVYDEQDKYLYSYIETHTLTFAKTTFTYAVNRKETTGTSYDDKFNEQTEGTYVIKYPEIVLTSEKYVKVGALSVGPTGSDVLLIDSGKENQPLLFIKK